MSSKYPGFDFKAPDYPSVWQARANRLAWIREAPAVRIPMLKAHYRENPADFIDDFGETFDPRNADVGLPTFVPFVLMPRQREFIEYVMRKWRARENGLAEKTRDAGLSWLATSLGCTLCLLHEGLVIGYGSRKEEYVDKVDGPKSLFFKARKFMERLPPEFNGGWNPKSDAPHMRLIFRSTNSTMTGEAGDNIGRGDRASIYFTDEEAFLERPQLIEASLSQTTNCRISISTPNGSANPFAQKRFGGRIEVFTYHWRDDLRKGDEWYAKQVADLDPVTLAQEVDIDYNASVEGVLIPSMWVQASIDAHLKLGLAPSGDTFGAMDVADEGIDKNAYVGGQGFLVDVAEEWSGKGGDIFQSTERAFLIADEHGHAGFLYDADGLGAGVRGDANVINGRRPFGTKLWVEPFRGSGEVMNPEKAEFYKRANKDFFANRKAQAWWLLRQRFMRTFQWVQEGRACDPDDIISLSSKLARRDALTLELSQPTYSINTVGKITVDKKPEGAKSPNLADAIMIKFSGARAGRLRVSSAAVAAAKARRRA